MVADESIQRYPYAIAVKTALRSYQAVRVLVTPELEGLVMPQLLEIRELISEAFDVKLSTSTAISKKQRVRWEAKEMTEWVSKLNESVSKFEDRVEQLLRACDKVNSSLNLLHKVSYDTTMFEGVLSSIQKTIDEMSLSGYNELDAWVQVVGDRIGVVLVKRLEIALHGWNKAFKPKILPSGGVESDDPESRVDEDEVVQVPEFTTKVKVELDIVLRNQEISPVPSVPAARSIFLNKLHEFIGVVCSLPRPRSGKYEVFESSKTSDSVLNENFDSLVQMVSPNVLADAYGSLEDHIRNASSFVDQWLAYQTLWDTQVSEVAATVGNDVEKWQSLLREAAEARSTLDSSATVAEFGPIVIRYGKVQSQINLKYDSWQRELQSSFAAILGQCTEDCHSRISSAKSKLEETTLDSAATENIVLGVTFVQEVKQKVVPWAKELESLRVAEKILRKQRYIFTADWIEVSVVKGLYDSLMQILERRTRTMEQQIPLLQARVAAEDKTAAKQLSALLGTWREEKPLRGNVTPPAALETLAKYEISLKKAHVHQENLVRAKDALGLEQGLENTEVVESLNELSDLKEVWEAVLQPFNSLEAIKDTPWATAVMRKVRSALDGLLAEMRSLPNRIRQYDAYTQLHETVKGYISGHGLLSELKTEGLKDRHWKIILQRLGVRTPFSDLSVGVLWDHGLLSRKKDMAEILQVAQGEMALEVFLGQVRERWTKQELELVLFQQRTRLIR